MAYKIKEIAQMAGVSASTVSRIINGKTCVNETTKKRVLEIIKENDYHPSAIAQSLKYKQTKTICLMLPTIENIAYAPITKGVEEVARENDYIVIICNTDDREDIELKYINTMKSRMVDGFIVCSAIGEHKNITALREENYPVVLASRYDLSDIGKIDVCTVNDYQAAYIVTEYLIKTNHKHIALAIGDENILYSRERLRGYTSALNDYNMALDENIIMHFEKNNSCFYQKTLDLMKLHPEVDAIFASSDTKAIYILKALHEMDIRVPEDISVFGYDNIEIASATCPPLSTVSQSPFELGKIAAENLLRQIEYKKNYGKLPEPEFNISEHKLFIRDSCMAR